MSVRRRKWTKKDGTIKETWLVDYTDQNGKRHAKAFAKKKDADAFASTTHVEVRGNVHIADSNTITVKEAGELWIARAKQELERGTVVQYRQHLDLHIAPFIGGVKLSKITVPFVRQFMDQLKENGRSPAMVRGVRTSLGSILSEAQDRGFAIRNAVRDMSGKRGTTADKRRKKKLEYGVDIPTREEIQKLIRAAEGRFRPLLITAIFTGLRSSELRGLRWADVDLTKKKLRVTQRADSYHTIGMPKSEKGQRSVPLPPMAVNALKEWKLQCPKGEKKLDLVFPNTLGNIEAHGNIIRSGLHPTMLAAGVTVDTGKVNLKGEPILAPKYTGLHSLRHWFASWCINRVEDGGLGLPSKVVQERLGHSTIVMTLDTYGHLFPTQDDDQALERAERALMAPVASAT